MLSSKGMGYMSLHSELESRSSANMRKWHCQGGGYAENKMTLIRRRKRRRRKRQMPLSECLLYATRLEEHQMDRDA